MAKKKPAKKNVGPGSEAAAATLPPGVKLLRTLEGQESTVYCVAFDPQGRTLASGSDDTARLCEWQNGKQLLALSN